MIRRTIRRVQLICLGLALLTAHAAGAAQTLDAYLQQGQADAAIRAFENPRNDAERFSLALAQVLDGVQQFSAGMNELSIRPDSPLLMLPFFRITTPRIDRQPGDPIGVATPAAVRHHFQGLRTSMRDAYTTLSQVQGEEFGVTVDVARIRLDFDGDGEVAEDELLVDALSELLGRGWTQDADSNGLLIRFDSADAAWLSGYAHFVAGSLDILLGYDWSPVWNQCAHELFLAPDPFPPLQKWVDRRGGIGDWIDLVAAVHDMRLECVDPESWQRARAEFESMFADSRECWSHVLVETDDEHEWLPSPQQTGPRGATISQPEIEAWFGVLDEMSAILSGKRLLPHARLKDGAGINLDRFIESPPPLDLVLWIQGSALMPYFEYGEVSDGERWNALTAPFGPGFVRFAIWSN